MPACVASTPLEHTGTTGAEHGHARATLPGSGMHVSDRTACVCGGWLLHAHGKKHVHSYTLATYSWTAPAPDAMGKRSLHDIQPAERGGARHQSGVSKSPLPDKFSGVAGGRFKHTGSLLCLPGLRTKPFRWSCTRTYFQRN